MSRSKKIFILFAIAFIIMLSYLSYDISRKTTFPGSKPQLKERLKTTFGQPDTSKRDTIRR